MEVGVARGWMRSWEAAGGDGKTGQRKGGKNGLKGLKKMICRMFICVGENRLQGISSLYSAAH